MSFDVDNFPALPNAWIAMPVEDAYELVTVSSKIQAKGYLKNGKLPVVDQGSGLVGGYTDDIEAALVTSLPVVVFGDHTRAVKFVDFPFAAGADGIKVLRPKSCYDPQLFYYFLCAIRLPDRGYARHFQYLRTSKMPLPPSEEQKRISDKLDTVLARVDACRERLDRIPTILKRFRQSILAAATSGKLTEEWRGTIVSCPPWRNATVGDMYTLVDGDRGPNYPKQSDYYSEGHCLFLSTKNVRPFGFVFDDVVFVSKKKHEQLRNGSLQLGDVVITTRGTLGNVAVYDAAAHGLHKVVRINSGMLILREKVSGTVVPDYLKLFIASPLFYAQLASKQTGSAQPQIPGGILKTFDFEVPSVLEQIAIVTRVHTLFEYADRIEARYNTAHTQIERLTPALLAKAFRGELVPQDPNDEPASVLLERIRTKRVDHDGALVARARKTRTK